MYIFLWEKEMIDWDIFINVFNILTIVVVVITLTSLK